MQITTVQMHSGCHCDTDNIVPWLTFIDPLKPEIGPGVQEESELIIMKDALLKLTNYINFCIPRIYMYTHYV